MYEKFIDSGIISAGELAELLKRGAGDVVVLDATYVLPGAGEHPREGFALAHIPGARLFDVDEFADKGSPLPHMLCGPEQFARMAGALGIGRESFVVAYGQGGTAMGPARAWWSFRAHGHERVAVLDGGLAQWKAAGLPVECGDAAPARACLFEPAAGVGLIAARADVRTACEGGGVLILDARPAARFSGEAPEPRAGLRQGHIPGSGNIPAASLFDSQTGCLLPPEELRGIYERAGLADGRDIILSCGSGVTACALALGLHRIGVQRWRVYDGSWAEWGDPVLNCPVERSD